MPTKSPKWIILGVLTAMILVSGCRERVALTSIETSDEPTPSDGIVYYHGGPPAKGKGKLLLQSETGEWTVVLYQDATGLFHTEVNGPACRLNLDEVRAVHRVVPLAFDISRSRLLFSGHSTKTSNDVQALFLLPFDHCQLGEVVELTNAAVASTRSSTYLPPPGRPADILEWSESLIVYQHPWLADRRIVVDIATGTSYVR